MKSTYSLIPTHQIDFDRENPRIKVALEKYGDKLDDQRIRFALQTATEGSASASSYRSLKDSIRAARGISVPIVVWPDNGRFVCVDGNTRLTAYYELHDESAPGDWTAINCLVLDDPDQRDIETIRVTAHLVGAREWPAYEKARYLHYLRNVEFMDYDELVARCGGNKKTITQQIDAYHDMNEFYRDVNSDDAFKVDRFSGFVELQKTTSRTPSTARVSTSATSAAGYATARYTDWPMFESSPAFLPTMRRKTPLSTAASDQSKTPSPLPRPTVKRTSTLRRPTPPSPMRAWRCWPRRCFRGSKPCRERTTLPSATGNMRPRTRR